MASPSWRIIRATSAFLPRVVSGISTSSRDSSLGMRLAYSCQPSSTQRGIREPTAISLIRTAARPYSCSGPGSAPNSPRPSSPPFTHPKLRRTNLLSPPAPLPIYPRADGDQFDPHRCASLFLLWARLGAELRTALLSTLPQTLKVIELASCRQHHVNHDVAEVEQCPLAGIHAFSANWAYALLLDLLQHVVDQRLNVTARGAAGDQHEIGDAGLAAHVDGGDVLRLDFFQSADGQFDQLFALHFACVRHN